MGRIVPIPAAGVADRKTSDGTSIAIGKQPQRGTPLDRVNFVSVARTDSIAAAQSAAAPFSFYFEGDGTITVTADSNLAADTDIVLSGRNAAGNVETETLTIASGAAMPLRVQRELLWVLPDHRDTRIRELRRPNISNRSDDPCS